MKEAMAGVEGRICDCEHDVRGWPVYSITSSGYDESEPNPNPKTQKKDEGNEHRTRSRRRCGWVQMLHGLVHRQNPGWAQALHENRYRGNRGWLPHCRS